MFDLGFGELMLLALVALVVLGPERLPKAARFAGLWVRRARAQWYSVKSELEREMAAEDLKENLDAARTAATDLERGVRSAVSDVDREVRQAGEDAQRGLVTLRDGLAAGVEPGASSGAAADAAKGLATGDPTADADADAHAGTGTGTGIAMDTDAPPAGPSGGDAPPAGSGGRDGC
ncbi:Sec-independent protein translocase protein TatB [Luteimonas sp. MJ246]|uniref:Sec-independent protein translocase protein TatB n=1 Tax=Luteimonas sp. MJ174 TaxID=3129237 RepID=UPI0031BAFBF7